jgi:glycine hydroxymethyltransferase
MVDMAHFAGLVAGKVLTGDFDPVPFAHIVTTTTHKTLRGPRGGLVLCNRDLAEFVDRGCPLVLGGPLPHVMAAKAVALREASAPSFREYAAAVVDNARELAEGLVRRDVPVVTGGTDNHLVLVDVRPFGLNGRLAESALRAAGITLNRNVVPDETNGAWYTSGLRLGTPAVTTLGMRSNEMEEIAAVITEVLRATTPAAIASGRRSGQPSQVHPVLEPTVAEAARARISDLLGRYPLYPELDLGPASTDAEM